MENWATPSPTRLPREMDSLISAASSTGGSAGMTAREYTSRDSVKYSDGTVDVIDYQSPRIFWRALSSWAHRLDNPFTPSAALTFQI